MADEDPKCWHRFRRSEEDYNQLQKSAFTKWINKCLTEVRRRNSRSFSRERSLQLAAQSSADGYITCRMADWLMHETPLRRNC